MNHTPGPWTMELNEDPDMEWEVNTDDGQYIADIIGGYALEQVTADARLIAEAPELLEALRTVFTARGISFNAHGEPYCNWCEGKGESGLEADIEHIDACPFAAIAKATGKENDVTSPRNER